MYVLSSVMQGSYSPQSVSAVSLTCMQVIWFSETLVSWAVHIFEAFVGHRGKAYAAYPMILVKPINTFQGRLQKKGY